MRIERHLVGEAALSSAVENFAERAGGEVHRMQNDESPARGWEMVADSFLDYLGARSVGNPELAGKDARIACESAAAAAVGALALNVGRAGHPHVFVEYTGTGVPYGEGRRRSSRTGSSRTPGWTRSSWPSWPNCRTSTASCSSRRPRPCEGASTGRTWCWCTR
ncbi:hypothetical protein ACFQ0T_30690 [Kitasatospora gansuensis]